MNALHTKEEIKVLINKRDLARDLVQLQHKYKLIILKRVIEEINDEIKKELDRYKSYIGRTAYDLYSDSPQKKTIHEFNFNEYNIVVTVHDGTEWFTWPLDRVELI